MPICASGGSIVLLRAEAFRRVQFNSLFTCGYAKSTPSRVRYIGVNNQAEVPASSGWEFMSTGRKVFRVLPLDSSSGSLSSEIKHRNQRRSRSAEGDLLTPAMRKAVDEWAAAQPDPQPSRSEAIHRLLERGLAR